MARKNGYDVIAKQVAGTLERQMNYLPPMVRKGKYPPFTEVVSGHKLDTLIDQALSGNQAAEQLLRQAVAATFTLHEQQRGGASG